MNLRAPLPPLATEICRLVLGTSFGGTMRYPEFARLLDSYVARGGNCFDTALVYYDSESLLGRWMGERHCRDVVTVIAKIAHPENDTSRVTPACIQADLEQTLKSLQTDYVDVLMLHRDDPSKPVGPILETLERLRQSGAIRAYAASNWTIDRLRESADYASANGLSGFAGSSVYYSLAVPTELPWSGCVAASDPASEAWYKRSQMPLLAWSALGFGYFAAAEGASGAESVAVRVAHDATGVDLARVFPSPINERRRRRAIELGRTKHATATQIALAWVLSRPLNLFAVVGPRNDGELRQLFDAFSLSLSEDEMDLLTG